MIDRKRVFLLVVLFTFTSQLNAAVRKGLSVKSISPTQRVLTITSDKTSVLSLIDGSYGSVPYISFPFVSTGNVSYSVQRSNPAILSLSSPPPAFVDSSTGLPGVAEPDLAALGASSGVILKQVGIMRGRKVFSLIVVPYVYSPTSRQLTYYESVTVSLNSTQPFAEDFDKPSGVLSSKLTNKVQSSAPPPAGSYIRIIVNQDGIYHVSATDLDTSHVNLSGFTSQNMTLWNHGKQIPIYVHTSGGTAFTGDSYFEFYGTANRVNYSGGRPDLYADPFTDNNVYLLTDDSTAPAQRLVTESGALNRVSNAVDLSGYSFTQTAHLEKDLRFERLDAVDLNQNFDRRDHWFWAEVSSNHTVTVPFTLSYPDTTSIQPLTLTAAFHGITHLDGSNNSPNVPNEHQAELFINQTHVLNSTWDDQNIQISSVGSAANIPQSVLHNGSNNLQVFDANPGNVAVSTFALNWVELEYQRLYVADNDYIKFTIPDNAQPGYYNFLIQNFHNSTVSVYRLNVSKITDITIRYINTPGSPVGYTASFQAYMQSPDDQLIAVSDAGKLRPILIEQVPNSGLSSYDYSADYIIISSRQLDDITKTQDPSNPVNQLASWYNTHGVKTLVVDAVQVYDDFNYGIKSPYAIRDFISNAYHKWSSAPKYVLLVGRGTWDTKNGHDVTNLLPVMLVQTYTFGATSADNFYACVDGDDPLPDVAVGRIPALTSDQLKSAIDKTLSYYLNKSFGWQNSTLLIAGEEEVFHTQTDSVVHAMIPSHFFTERLYTSIQDPQVDTKYYGTTQDLLNHFNQGVSLVNYMGHGGGAIWADNGILTNDEVSSMSNNGKYPFIASMTCFAGAFDGQEGVPLSSTLLFAQNKGAVGLVASSGLGWLLNDFYMDSQLLPLIFDSTRSNTSVGSNLILAKAEYYASYYYWPQSVGMIGQYNLIGDPALVIQLPPNNSSVRLNSYTASAGQTVSGSVSGGPAGGTGTVELTNFDGDIMAQSNVTLDNSGSGNFNIPFSGGFAGVGHAKVYVHNSTAQSSSSIDFSTESSFAQIERFGITSNGSAFQLSIGALASSGSGFTSVNFVGKIYSSINTTGDRIIATLNIPLSLSAQSEYSATFSVGGDTLKPGEIIIGSIVANVSSGGTFTGTQASYTVPGASDISAYSPGSYVNVNSTIKVVADTSVRLQAFVYDWNKVPAQNVRVDFYDGAKNPAGKFLGSVRVGFDTLFQQLASVPVNLTTGSHRIYMYLAFDSLTNGYDLHPENNFASSTINVDYTSASPGGTVILDTTGTLTGASPGQIFQVDQLSPVLFQQPFIILAKYKSGGSQFCRFLSIGSSQSGSYTVSVLVTNPDSTTKANLSALHLYIYDDRTHTVNKVGGNFAAGAVSATVSSLGTFVAGFSSDNTPPQVTVSVGEQFFSDGDNVPPNPRFSLLLHDEDGIYLSRKSIKVLLDNQQIDTSLIILPDTVTNPTSVTAAVQLPLTSGAHALVLSAEDANGNVSAPVTVNFVVRSDFNLKVYGAYPNPFINDTFIAFDVTSSNPIDAVEVKIYSVSGRLVKTIRYPSNDNNETFGLLRGGTGSPTAVGYHEAWWDGTDNFQNQVANGVYFYKVSVSSGGKTVQDIGKLARLR
ncbi:MAG TPA: C25 family cysteine peptidase [Candidatus Kryptonia bacterium]